MVSLRKITGELERRAPRHLAEDWDNVGLQVGDLDSDVTRILISLDVTDEVVDEAIARHAGLIVSHHPAIFRPLSRLVMPNALAGPVIKAVKANIGIYSMHTNLDKVRGGTSHILASRLGVDNLSILTGDGKAARSKLVTFVPENFVVDVYNALTASGAGSIGDYSGCSFKVSGTGTFYPEKGANPHIGEVGKTNEEPEIRLEMTVEAIHLKEAIAAMVKAHPYEQVAYDVYPLISDGESGLGVVGDLSASTVLEDFANHCRDVTGSKEIKVAGDLDGTIRRIAVCGGSGGSLVAAAKKARADVLITGDVGYHQAHEAKSRNLAIIDVGHLASEVMVLDVIEDWLTGIDSSLEVLRSGVDLLPWDLIG